MTLTIDRIFTTKGQDALDSVEYEKRDCIIKNQNGETIHELKNIEVPSTWSQLATDIVASKYFKMSGVPNERGHENSVKELINRVVNTIRDSGVDQGGYFSSHEEEKAFEQELKYILVNQMAAFNSPVWFNCGLHQYGIEGNGGSWAWDSDTDEIVETTNSYERPQCSACFIQKPTDDLMGIYDLVKTEARLFKYGSGTGSNFSCIRGKNEPLSGGGTSSGLLSFLEVLDKSAGATKSGGTVRRAAKLVCLDMDHPDALEFIQWKVKEEEKAKALIAAGYDSDFNGEAYATVSGQNSNNSVRVTDEFMETVINKGKWKTTFRTNSEVANEYDAEFLWNQICEAAWKCADPGVQYDTAINFWHTCPNTDRINASNPCCFTGDTKVETSEGAMSFDELMCLSDEELPYVWSWDSESRMPVLRKINKVWQSGKAKDLIEVTTDKGGKFYCTPEHKWMLRNGSYVEARLLTAGTSLRKIGRGVNHNLGSRKQVYTRTIDGKDTFWQNRYIWEQVHGPIPEGFHVHHKNEDPTDDRLSNLELRKGEDHITEHTSGKNNPRYIEIDSELLVDTWDAVASTPKGTHKNGKLVTPTRWNKYIKQNNLMGLLPMANTNKIQGMSWSSFASSVEEHRADINDKVRSVKNVPLGEAVPVYDMEVEGTHCFSLATEGVHGLIVHNSEYMFLDNSACNLSSINLLKFCDTVNKTFDYESFCHTVKIMILAQEILVDLSSYPTKEIARNSHDYRPLGLGYANLGSLLMHLGMPYDSKEGRELCGAITSLMTAYAYLTSCNIAKTLPTGAFKGFPYNKQPMLGVISEHHEKSKEARSNCSNAGSRDLVDEAFRKANVYWETVQHVGTKHGFRNAQISVLAPTGTIGLLMDCDTTGIEPEFSLVKYKKLAGGGYIKMVNAGVEQSLRNLGYDDSQIASILNHVKEHDTVEGSLIKTEDLSIFSCANRCGKTGKQFIRPEGHLLMMAAAQPFLSGSISKTVNIPNDATVEDISRLYMMGWELGLKSVAMYRDGCKSSQPLNTSNEKDDKQESALPSRVDDGLRPPTTVRHKLPGKRGGFTQEAKVGNNKIFLRTGEYEDGSLGEIFIDMHKEGASFSALMNCFAISISMGLQHGVPIENYVEQFTFTRFEPSGSVQGHPNVKFATSMIDYVFRVLGVEYCGREDLAHVKTTEVNSPKVTSKALYKSISPVQTSKESEVTEPNPTSHLRDMMGDAPMCTECGHVTVRNAACYKCLNCGSSMGCS